jgi:phenylpropionate dioxygenase-like ring-hydroxylating dioxygenase large terminal subunit
MLNHRWYPIVEATSLRRKPIELKRLGISLALWRDAEGQPRVVAGACPHRGAAMGTGRVVDGELECPWHGFRFDGTGRCTLMPCEGKEARIPKAMRLQRYPVREAHGLIWMWWGDEREDYPPLPFFESEVDRVGSTDASYILPYHYSRMVETNLDIHHTPFVHGNVVPVGTRVLDFDAHVEGDRIYSSGVLVKEKELAQGASKGMPFRADLILPNLGLVELTPNLRILVCASPVDDHHTWMWFRYCQTYSSNALIGKLITWISVKSELRIVQRQDWRLFEGLTPGTIDEYNYTFVQSDKAIALYRKLRAQLLDAEARVQGASVTCATDPPNPRPKQSDPHRQVPLAR